MKRQALRDWIRAEPVKNAIIFCNRKRDVDILYKSLAKHGFNVGCLHGDMDQRHRTATLDAFRNGTLTLLAASDVAARGLDIPEVSHVFNFDVPIAAEDYVHRIGRTGRAGRSGFSATLVTDDDMRTLRDIERMLKASVEWVGAPPPEDAGTKSGRRKRLAEAGTGRDERRDGRRGRGEGRGSRPPRHSGDHPRRRETAPELALPAALVPADAQPEIAFWPATEIAPPRERREPRRDRAKHAHSGDDSPSGEPRERRPRHHAETADAQPREERGPRPRRPQRQPQPERERVVGMGSHVPAFMRRPPRGTPGGRD
jgi:superfamily II DNA/RNA helicase